MKNTHWLLAASSLLAAGAPSRGGPPVVEKLTPVLAVEEIEPVLPFWVERLGFAVTAEVPEGDRLGFVILEKNGIEVMYQTRESLEADAPTLADAPAGGSILFLRVEALDPVLEALKGVPVVVPRRRTSYGADEIFVREPGGHVVGFAAFGGE